MGKEFQSRAEVLQAIQELKARFPAHSLKPAMMQELEDLEELLEQFPVTASEPDRSDDL
ncbi:MAG: histidine kinase [Peptococcaceae bacterium]|nr:histidine kinase [Peptococcaceae bacterium]